MVKKTYRFVNNKRQNVFLNYLIECGGSISKAAAKSGISRQTHYDWLDRDNYYASVYTNKIKPMCTSVLEDEALRRAMGYEEGIYYKGEKVGTVTRYSDRLMELLLKANAPEKYRERSESIVKTDEPAVISWADGGDDGD